MFCVSECGSGQFDCGGGQCIVASLVCNAVVNCDNSLDESNCSHKSKGGFSKPFLTLKTIRDLRVC